MTAFNIIKSLTKRGNVVLGAGCYSAVLQTSTDNKVLKVGAHANDPWLDYYSLVIKKHEGNPHVPNAHNLHVYSDFDYYVCFMEKLTPVDTIANSDLRKIVWACEKYASGRISKMNFMGDVDHFAEAVPDPLKLLEVLDSIKEHTQALKCEDADPSARTLDLHEGNFMLRDGILVITDPWCENDMSDVASVEDWVSNSNNKSYYELSSSW